MTNARFGPEAPKRALLFPGVRGVHVIIRRKEVMKRCGLQPTAFDDLRRRDPTFPKPIYILPRHPGWFEAEVDAWLETYAASRVSGSRRDGRAA